MQEADATPIAIVNWFRDGHSNSDVMLLWVSGERHHEKTLRDLLHEVAALDTVLLDNVTFLFLSHARAPAVIRSGEDFECAPFRGLNRLDFLDNDAEQTRVARATMRGAAEFAKALGLTPSDVPCVVVLVRGIEENIVVTMGPGMTLGGLRTWLQSVVDAVTRHRKRSDELELAAPDWDRLAYVARHAKLILPSMRAKFRATLDGLVQRYPRAADLGSSLMRLVIEVRRV